MIEIVRVMLAEGLDEGTIHKVLDLIEAEYNPENPDVAHHGSVRRHYKKVVKQTMKPFNQTFDKQSEALRRLLNASGTAVEGRKLLKRISQEHKYGTPEFDGANKLVNDLYSHVSKLEAEHAQAKKDHQSVHDTMLHAQDRQEEAMENQRKLRREQS